VDGGEIYKRFRLTIFTCSNARTAFSDNAILADTEIVVFSMARYWVWKGVLVDFVGD
jgi:hypothetical protein